jgi:hypothetical protein
VCVGGGGYYVWRTQLRTVLVGIPYIYSTGREINGRENVLREKFVWAKDVVPFDPVWIMAYKQKIQLWRLKYIYIYKNKNVSCSTVNNKKDLWILVKNLLLIFFLSNNKTQHYLSSNITTFFVFSIAIHTIFIFVSWFTLTNMGYLSTADSREVRLVTISYWLLNTVVTQVMGAATKARPAFELVIQVSRVKKQTAYTKLVHMY